MTLDDCQINTSIIQLKLKVCKGRETLFCCASMIRLTECVLRKMTGLHLPQQLVVSQQPLDTSLDSFLEISLAQLFTFDTLEITFLSSDMNINKDFVSKVEKIEVIQHCIFQDENREEYLEAFNAFDWNHSGKISFSNLQVM